MESKILIILLVGLVVSAVTSHSHHGKKHHRVARGNRGNVGVSGVHAAGVDGGDEEKGGHKKSKSDSEAGDVKVAGGDIGDIVPKQSAVSIDVDEVGKLSSTKSANDKSDGGNSSLVELVGDDVIDTKVGLKNATIGENSGQADKLKVDKEGNASPGSKVIVKEPEILMDEEHSGDGPGKHIDDEDYVMHMN